MEEKRKTELTVDSLTVRLRQSTGKGGAQQIGGSSVTAHHLGLRLVTSWMHPCDALPIVKSESVMVTPVRRCSLIRPATSYTQDPRDLVALGQHLGFVPRTQEPS